MRELPGFEGDYEEPKTLEAAKPKSPTSYDLEKNLDNADLAVLSNMNYPRPNDFFDTDTKRLREIRDEVKNDVKNIYRTNSWFELKKKNKKQNMIF